jgi:phage baseplate assembly protein W
MATPVRRIRYPFALDAGAGRLAEELDYDAYVRQLIRQALLTAQGERINRPDFGAGVRRMVFAPNSQGTASLTETFVYQALTTWLANVIRVERVAAAAIEERLEVSVEYIVIANGERRFLNVEVAA